MTIGDFVLILRAHTLVYYYVLGPILVILRILFGENLERKLEIFATTLDFCYALRFHVRLEGVIFVLFL